MAPLSYMQRFGFIVLLMAANFSWHGRIAAPTTIAYFASKTCKYQSFLTCALKFAYMK